MATTLIIGNRTFHLSQPISAGDIYYHFIRRNKRPVVTVLDGIAYVTF